MCLCGTKGLQNACEWVPPSDPIFEKGNPDFSKAYITTLIPADLLHWIIAVRSHFVFILGLLSYSMLSGSLFAPFLEAVKIQARNWSATRTASKISTEVCLPTLGISNRRRASGGSKNSSFLSAASRFARISTKDIGQPASREASKNEKMLQQILVWLFWRNEINKYLVHHLWHVCNSPVVPSPELSMKSNTWFIVEPSKKLACCKKFLRSGWSWRAMTHKAEAMPYKPCLTEAAQQLLGCLN